jgi:uncharacterized membrane protein
MRISLAKKAGLLAISASLLFGASVFAQAPAEEPTVEEQLKELRQNLDEAKEANGNLDEYGNRKMTDEEAAAVLKALPPDEYYVGRIESIEAAETKDYAGVRVAARRYQIRVENGAEKGRVVAVEDNDLESVVRGTPPQAGDKVALVKLYDVDGNASYHIADRYRVTALMWMALLFFVAASVFGGKRGITSAFGLAATVVIIAGWAVPRIMAGGAAFPTMLAATAAAALISLYLAHGVNIRTTLALAGTLITLALAVAVELVAVGKTWLTGLGSEEAFFLQGITSGVDLRGLLLGGILLGVLGILDDVTTAQVAVVEELKAANPRFGFTDLYRRGLSVGKEHIASLTNTLFLAYAGASLPLFLLFSINKSQPLWFIVNSELISEEIVRTLVGSICLILAVPISTAIAAKWFATRPATSGGHEGHGHHH